LRGVIPVAPPYALATPRFRFRALALLAGRAPLGGAREVALATFVVARLVDDLRSPIELGADARSARATAARSWLASLALPANVRVPFAKLVDASALTVLEARTALARVIEVTSTHLDGAARTELESLLQALGG
jgi:hypothetical protein